jgi:hypothetical protein
MGRRRKEDEPQRREAGRRDFPAVAVFIDVASNWIPASAGM